MSALKSFYNKLQDLYAAKSNFLRYIVKSKNHPEGWFQ